MGIRFLGGRGRVSYSVLGQALRSGKVTAERPVMADTVALTAKGGPAVRKFPAIFEMMVIRSSKW
jgi:hypothetical protein